MLFSWHSINVYLTHVSKPRDKFSAQITEILLYFWYNRKKWRQMSILCIVLLLSDD